MPIAVGTHHAFGVVEGLFVFRTASESGRVLVPLVVDLTKEELGRGREPAQNPDGPSDAQVESV